MYSVFRLRIYWLQCHPYIYICSVHNFTSAVVQNVTTWYVVINSTDNVRIHVKLFAAKHCVRLLCAPTHHEYNDYEETKHFFIVMSIFKNHKNLRNVYSQFIKFAIVDDKNSQAILRCIVYYSFKSTFVCPLQLV